MSRTLRRAGLLSASLATLGLLGWALAADALTGSAPASEHPATPVELGGPGAAQPALEPGDPLAGNGATDGSADGSADGDGEEKCTSGCSLGKHPIPPYGRGDFAKARYQYAQEAPEAESEALETLLFYGAATREFLDDMGSGPLSPAHQAFLQRELARAALVQIRMVDDAGRVRVAYGPQRVPFGIKQHLHPVDHDLQPLEFNGTVMRTGVNYLWSRY